MKDNFQADLHCHSTCSDGTTSPEELIQLASQLGLKGLAITDHDTIAAYTPALLTLAQKQNIQLLSGVEFSSWHRAEPVHVLAYAFPLTSSLILDLCQWHLQRRIERNRQIIRNLQKLGIAIREEELPIHTLGTLGRPHIAALLMEKGIVASLQEAFHKYLGESKPAYAPGKQLSTEETIDRIHQAGGFAILAHPHLLKRTTTIRDLLKLPFDGLEGYYAKIPLDQEKRWLDEAQKRQWLITGGSDYHGEVKPQIPLGCSWVGEETFQKLYAHFTSHTPTAPL